MQTRHAITLAVRLVAMLALVGALALLGCSEDDEDTVIIGSQVAALNANNAAALEGETFTFRGGVTEFGTAGSTDVLYDAGEGTPGSQVEISTAGDTASAGAEYGSCIFDVIDSTFETGPLRPDGPRIRIAVCSLVINGGEFTVDGPSGPCTIRLRFNDALSADVEATCSIDADGNIVVNGAIVTGSIGVGE